MTSYSNTDSYRRRARTRARQHGARGVFDGHDVQARLDKQNARCHYCGEEVGYVGKDKFQVDHWIPLSRGGSNWASNIVIACPGCNKAKGSQLPWEFRPARWAEGARRDD